MASHKKIKFNDVSKIFRHDLRLNQSYKNKDIDLSKSQNNTVLFDGDYDLWKKRISELEIHKKKDVVGAVSVVVTLPRELSHYTIEDQDTLFSVIVDFLNKRYKRKNMVSAVVHRDELGQPHLHYVFVPAVHNTINKYRKAVSDYLNAHKDANNSEVARALGISRKTVRYWRDKISVEEKKEKLCAFEVINKKDLISFHSDLVNFIDESCEDEKLGKIGKFFYTGITKAQGGNKTVEQLKAESKQIELLKEKITTLEKQIENSKKQEKRFEWEF